MRNRSLFNNDYSGYVENPTEEFSLEDNFLDDIRFNHDLGVDETPDVEDYAPLPRKYRKIRSAYGYAN